MYFDLSFIILVVKKKNEVKGMIIPVFVTPFLSLQPKQKDFQHSIWTVSELA